MLVEFSFFTGQFGFSTEPKAIDDLWKFLNNVDIIFFNLELKTFLYPIFLLTSTKFQLNIKLNKGNLIKIREKINSFMDIIFMTKTFLDLILFPTDPAQELFAPSKWLSVFVSLLRHFQSSSLLVLFK